MPGRIDLAGRVEELLRRVQGESDAQPILQQIIDLFAEASGCESVGIRWKAGEDYPYFVTRGFGKDFVVREGPLCERDAAGLIVRHRDGSPQLACLCGAVVTGNADPRWPFFTRGGSFWTNQAQSVGPTLDSEKLGLHVRAYCVEVGYEVVALIPLRARDDILGLLQMNCREPGSLTLESVEEYEALANRIGEAVARVMREQPA